MQFADKVKEYRVANSLTQEQLAERLFVSRQAVSKWEQGRGYPSMTVLESLSKLLNVSIDELICSEQDKPLVIEANASIGWRLKNHLAKKMLIFAVPFLANLIYIWAYISIISSNLELRGFADLQAYQAYLQVISNYKEVAHFLILVTLIPAILNFINYSLIVAGILKARTFRVALLIVNIVMLTIELIPVIIVSVSEGYLGLSLGLLGAFLLQLMLTAGIVVLFFLETINAEKDWKKLMAEETLLKAGAPCIKRLPLLLGSCVFYITYMAIFLSVLYFSSKTSARHNLLYTYGNMALYVGLLIIIPAIITTCLFLLVLASKMQLTAYSALVLIINIPTQLLALIYALLSMAPAGGENIGAYLFLGTLITIFGYIVTLIVSINSAPLPAK